MAQIIRTGTRSGPRVPVNTPRYASRRSHLGFFFYQNFYYLRQGKI